MTQQQPDAGDLEFRWREPSDGRAESHVPGYRLATDGDLWTVEDTSGGNAVEIQYGSCPYPAGVAWAGEDWLGVHLRRAAARLS